VLQISDNGIELDLVKMLTFSMNTFCNNLNQKELAYSLQNQIDTIGGNITV
jgi:hypothetical protein